MIWFANFRLLSELSTPFLNFRWMMQQRGIRDSVLYNLNRLVFFGVFALCRIVTIPRYWLTVYNQSEAISNTSSDLIGILFVSGTVLGKIIRRQKINFGIFFLISIIQPSPHVRLTFQMISWNLAVSRFNHKYELF